VSLKSADVTQASNKASIELIPQLTVLLHSLADSSGWPKELVSQLSVSLSPDYEVFVDYPAEVAMEIEDLEYGTSGSLPNAVIRPFKARAHIIVEPVLEKRTLTDIFKGLGII
jgi:hypothetical protein